MHAHRLLLLVLLATLPGHAQSTPLRAALSTTDTHLELEAGTYAPRVTVLRSNLGEPNEWTGAADDALIQEVEIDGHSVPVTWTFDAAQSRQSAGNVCLVYTSQQPALRLEWEWTTRDASGAIEHRTTIRNHSGHELWLPLQPSLTLAWQTAEEALTTFSVEKGADTPSPWGTHRDPLPVGAYWFGESSSYAIPRAGRPREIIPYVAVERADGSGFFVGIEFSGKLRLFLSHSANKLEGTFGLDPIPGPFRTRLMPDENFETPTLFLSAYHGGADGAGNQLRRWERRVLGNPNAWNDPHYPVTVNNSWGSGVEVDEALALRMIDDSAELGLEMFHLDAGWFRAVGDWDPDPNKFPRGLAYVANAAHRKGLRFGLWIDWAQAGNSTQPGALNVHDAKVANWMVSDLPAGWTPESYKGQTLDIGVPAVRDWAQHKLKHIVEDFKLDMLEHDGYLVAKGCARTDHPHAAPGPDGSAIFEDAGFRFVEAANETDVSYHATRAYYEIYRRLRHEHPGLLLEICNDGGRMIDFGSLAHGDYFSATDTYDPLSNRRAVYDQSYVMPVPMLESYVETWPTPTAESFLYMLRSGMMGWFSVMTDTTKWTAEQHASAKNEIAFYKQTLRPLLRDGDLYHAGPRPDGEHWDGLEFYDPARGEGVLFAFRGKTEGDTACTFALRGLNADAHYEVRSRDGYFSPREMTGGELMLRGLRLEMPQPYSSDIVQIRLLSPTKLQHGHNNQ